MESRRLSHYQHIGRYPTRRGMLATWKSHVAIFADVGVRCIFLCCAACFCGGSMGLLRGVEFVFLAGFASTR